LRIAVCDDNPVELQKIKATIEQFRASKQPEVEITVNTFTDGDALLCGMKMIGWFDLVILDIIMLGMNGIDLAKEIRENGDNCKIIFLTSTSEYAVESYTVDAFYYLLKPYSEVKLASVIGMALLDMEDERSSSICVKSGGKIIRLRYHTIRYVESANHSVCFHLRDGSGIDCFGSLNEFHDALLVDRRFVTCHKSFIVNMDYVLGISSKEFEITENVRVPISRNVYMQVKSRYFDYFFDKGKGHRQ